MDFSSSRRLLLLLLTTPVAAENNAEGDFMVLANKAIINRTSD